MTYYATCHTPDNSDTDRRIQGLGGSYGWYDIDTIIRMIDSGSEFYTDPPTGVRRKIIVEVHPTTRRRYLKTEADGIVPNNILSLPLCR
jgi:hypothetical protein